MEETENQRTDRLRSAHIDETALAAAQKIAVYIPFLAGPRTIAQMQIEIRKIIIERLEELS